MIDYIKDSEFLKKLDRENIKKKFVTIDILDNNENGFMSIAGQVTSGNINGGNTAAIRKNGSLNVVVDNRNDDYSTIDQYLTKMTKIRIKIGIENVIDENYDDIIWYDKGVFVVTGVSINNSTDGINVSLSISDKMCLLNGDYGGVLPCSITFDSYVQVNDDGTEETIKQRLFDIIQTLVVYYGNERIENVIINDVPLTVKNIMRYTGDSNLYYNTLTKYFTFNEKQTLSDPTHWNIFTYGENVGYTYTDFTFPGELVSGIGDSVTSVLDQIIDALGNYEYFYDDSGRFIFQEKKNYLNSTYQVQVEEDNMSVVDSSNYKVDFSSANKSTYEFNSNDGLIISSGNTPNITNIKNDYHIWGKKTPDSSSIAIHYHVAIKEKPSIFSIYEVIFLEDESKIRLATSDDSENAVILYQPNDWRAELYLQALEEKKLGKRVDIYKQELLDNFDLIYNFQTKSFKVDLLKKPQELTYFLDYLNPVNGLAQYSVDAIGTKSYVSQSDTINAIYELEVPDIILINISDSESVSLIEECESKGQSYSNVTNDVYSTFSLGSSINTAQDEFRSLLYQYTSLAENITLTCIPVYYLDVNSRVTVNDENSGINGDYIVNSYTMPLDVSSFMSINASKALERV